MNDRQRLALSRPLLNNDPSRLNELTKVERYSKFTQLISILAVDN